MTDKPAREARYVRAEEIATCPRCHAQPGDQCRTTSGRWRRNPHKVRIEAMGIIDELTLTPEEER